jgi:hypothetical protein
VPALGKVHFDVEATFGSGMWDERGAVGAGDGADDGQAESESVSVGVSDSLNAELCPWSLRTHEFLLRILQFA